MVTGIVEALLLSSSVVGVIRWIFDEETKFTIDSAIGAAFPILGVIAVVLLFIGLRTKNGAFFYVFLVYDVSVLRMC